MTVEIVMHGLLGVLLDGLQSVAVELDVCLELELKASFIFAIDGDRPLIFTLARLCLIADDIAIRYKEIACVRGVLYAVWAEK